MKSINEPKAYLVSRPSVDWKQIARFLDDENVPGIPDSIRAGHDESAAIVEMVEAILFDQKRILPCAAYLEGEYGVQGQFMGVPVRLGAAGIEEILELKLTEAEAASLQHSANAVEELIEVMKSNNGG